MAVRGARQKAWRVLGKIVATACVTTSANSLSEICVHTLKKNRPPGRSMRRASR
jgi:hypothetical protein